MTWNSRIIAEVSIEPRTVSLTRQKIQKEENDSTEKLTYDPAVVEAYHSLRAQPEVMKYSFQGRPDKDLAESQTALDASLPPHDTEAHRCAIVLAATGELVGMGGCRQGTFSK